MNISRYLELTANKFPDKPAIYFQNERITYERLSDAVNRLGNGLRSLGVKKGDRVSVMLPNSTEMVIVHWAVVRLGAVFHPINSMFKEKELRYVLNNAASTVIITTPEFLSLVEEVWTDCPQLAHLVLMSNERIAGTVNYHDLISASSAHLSITDCGENDVCDLYYTSGTTGRPKGVMKTHLSLTKVMEYQSEAYRVTEHDHSLVVLPLFHSYAMIIPSMLPIYKGGTQTILERWDTETVLRTIVNNRVTFFAGVPTMYVYFIRHPGFDESDLTSLRLCLVAGAAIPVEVQAEFEKRANVKILDTYGCTGWTSSANPIEGVRKHGSIGKSYGAMYPHMDTQMRVVDDQGRDVPCGEVGELICCGPQIPPGFWRMPEKTRRDYRDGWFYTGDLSRVDADGYFYIVERKDDLIITAGYNVYPREVEEVLYGHPDVSEAAVIGSPDPVKGEIVKAFVVLKEGGKASPDDIIEFTRAQLSNYKIPREVELLAELPKTANGKLSRKTLRDGERRKHGKN